MKNKFLFMVCAVSALAHQVVRAEDASVSRTKTNPDIVELRNGLLGVQVDLSRGARVSSFRYKAFNSDDIVFDYQHSNGGLIKDLWTTQGWPGEFDKRKFDAEIVSAGPDEAVLRAWTTVTGDFKNKRNPELEGLILKKTFKLSKGSRVLKVQVEVENVTATSKRFAYWSQNALNFDGSLRKIFFWRPVQHGVDMIGTKRESEYGFWYTAVPRAGWNGVTDPEMERGVVFLMDYNSVEQLYDNTAAFTAEWMYDPVAVPSGKTWKTEIQVVPTEGFAGYSHADQDIIANFKATELPSGLNIQHILAATDRPLRNALIETELVGVSGNWKTSGKALEVKEINTSPSLNSVLITPEGSLPAIIRTTVSWEDAQGNRIRRVFEAYFGGKAGRNLNLELLQPMYKFEAPAKKPMFLKPDTIKLKSASDKPKILFVRGLWSEFQGVDEALAKMGNVEVVDAWMKKTALGEGLGNFPSSYDDLLSYDVIILGNMSGKMLGLLGEEMLVDFAQAGGGILLLAGDRTYGQANFTNPRFTDLLPAQFRSGGDYGKLASPSKINFTQGNALVEGISIPGNAKVQYAHRVDPKEGSVRVASFESGDPAVLMSAPGMPKVAMITALPFGKDDPKAPLYFRQAEWVDFMSKLIKGLMPTQEAK